VSELGLELEPKTFYRGVLLALRAHRRLFVTEGEPFHGAFRSLLDLTEREWPKLAREMRESHDPVFGVFEAADGMILEGMIALLIALRHPMVTTAYFVVGRAQAATELDEQPHAATFRRLGSAFHEQLAPSHASEEAAHG